MVVFKFVTLIGIRCKKIFGLFNCLALRIEPDVDPFSAHFLSDKFSDIFIECLETV